MAIKAQSKFSLKDQLFNSESLAELAEGVQRAKPDFDAAHYRDAVLAQFPSLELKQRIDCMVSELENHLPPDVQEATKILLDALPPSLDPDKSDDDFGRFIWVVPGEYVSKHGCTVEHLDRSLGFLRESTKRFSAEFAIRRFLREFPETSLEFMHECARDSHYHVRRFASEGIRPFLPWAERVILPYDDIIEVLDHLHADSTRFVTRSVANCLNDLSKQDPEKVVSVLERWNKQGQQQPAEMAWMTSHALRTLAKTDHESALRLLGYEENPSFELVQTEVSKTVRLDDSFCWKCQAQSNKKQKLRIGLKIYYMKANGQHKAKVFSVTSRDFEAGEISTIEKKIPFRATTTRVLYPGEHFAELIINGKATEKKRFSFLA